MKRAQMAFVMWCLSACATTPQPLPKVAPERSEERGPVKEEPAPVPPPAPSHPSKSLEETGVKLEIEPAVARVVVNGRALGELAEMRLERGLVKLSPGVHRIELSCPGYTTWRGEVVVGEQTETLQISLQRNRR